LRSAGTSFPAILLHAKIEAFAEGRITSSRPGWKIAPAAPMPIASANATMLKRAATALIFCLQAAKRMAIVSLLFANTQPAIRQSAAICRRLIIT
jgi:hypothetical protein